MMERHAAELGQARVICMVADDRDDVGGQFARAPPSQQVGQAVRLAGGKDCDPRPVTGELHLGVHAEPGGERRECRAKIRPGRCRLGQVELDPLEENTGLAVGVLLGVQDVTADVQDELGNRVNETRLISARDEQDRGSQRFLTRLMISRTTSAPAAPMTALPCGLCALSFRLCLACSLSRFGLVR
jgi:hypothetical protein